MVIYIYTMSVHLTVDFNHLDIDNSARRAEEHHGIESLHDSRMYECPTSALGIGTTFFELDGAPPGVQMVVQANEDL